jgi:hypothetical protein
MEPENIDPIKFAKAADRMGKSGELTRKLLAKGNAIYGVNREHPDYLERILPNGQRSLGNWKGGKFEVKISLLKPIQTSMD